jgi:TolA-binding protein
MAKFVLIALAVTTSAAFAQLQPVKPPRLSPFGSSDSNPLFAPFTLQPPATANQPQAKPRELSNDERIRQLEQEVRMLQDEVNQLKSQTELKFRKLN